MDRQVGRRTRSPTSQVGSQTEGANSWSWSWSISIVHSGSAKVARDSSPSAVHDIDIHRRASNAGGFSHFSGGKW